MTPDDMIWLRVGRAAPDALATARPTLHQAAQLAAAAALTLLDPAPEDSHTNILWDAEHGGFVGRPLSGGHHVFLDIRWFRAGLRDADGAEVGGFELADQTLAQALTALADILREAGYAVPDDGLTLPTYDLPLPLDAPLATPDTSLSRELARWYHDATFLLHRVAADHPEASEVRGWPHHFDLATLLTLGEGTTIGVGLSPGDGAEGAPYLYVTPWPSPDADVALPELPGEATWNREGWTGALLPASAITAHSSADAQRATARGFIDAAIAACSDLIG